MPGAMRKMGVYLGLVEDADGYDDYDRSPDGYDQPRDGHDDGYGRDSRDGYHRDGYGRDGYARDDRRSDVRELPRESAAARPAPRAEFSRPTEYGRATAVATREWTPAPAARDDVYDDNRAADWAEDGQPYRITTLHPRTYNEAVTIGEHFRSGTPVIMNLTEMADSDAKRLVDFAAGLTFGLHGRVERVTNKVFLLSPQNVTVTAQDKARIAENGFFNQS